LIASQASAVNTDNISRDDWIMGAVALLLIVDLLFLPWFSVTVGPITVSVTATGAPDSWLGVLAVLAAVALVADLVIDRLSPQTSLPSLAGGRTQTRFVLACLAAAFLALKFLFHIHFDLFGYGFWGAVVLAATLVYLTAQARTPRLLGRR
jgi:hypothetical protein